jgi:MFS family permease
MRMTRRLAVFVLFTAAYFMSYFFRSANAVIAPDLMREMGLSAANLGLMTSLFFAAFAAVQIPIGIGLDRWGPRGVTPAFLLIGVVGSLVFAVAPSFMVLTLGRALIGVGMAGVLMGAMKSFSQWFPAERFATASGLLVGIGSLGALLAATPLAWINAVLGWRSVFVVGAGLTALVALSIMLWARNTPPGVPWLGATTQQGSLRTVFSDARFWRIAPLVFFLSGILQGFQGLWAGPYLFDVQHLSKVEAGNVLLLLSIGATVGYTTSGWLADRFGITRVIVVVSVLFIASQYGLALHPALGVVRLLYVLFGLTGGFNVMLTAQTRQIFPLSITGKAVTGANLFAIGGVFVLQWLMGLIINRFPVDATGRYPPQAHTAALLFTATGTLLALLWYLPMTRRTVSQ